MKMKRSGYQCLLLEGEGGKKSKQHNNPPQKEKCNNTSNFLCDFNLTFNLTSIFVFI